MAGFALTTSSPTKVMVRIGKMHTRILLDAHTGYTHTVTLGFAAKAVKVQRSGVQCLRVHLCKCVVTT